MAREYLLAGKMQVEQTKNYLNSAKRIIIARKFIEGAAFNMLILR
jgi:CRISPR-associated protein Cas1